MIKVIPNILPKEFTLLVSGGVDSIAAAHWLHTCFHRRFSIIHFNHMVQNDNMKMEETVKDFASKLNIPFSCFRRTDTIDKYSKFSESYLREFRLSMMKNIGGNYVTAHHLDDCCENYLMNCFHGTPEYKPIQEITKLNDNTFIHHPFLITSKSSFQKYVDTNNLKKYIVEDKTNKDNKYKRNWIRNKILPILNENQLGIDTIVRKKFY